MAERLITRYGREATIYRPANSTLQDGNVVPDEVCRIGTSPVHFRFNAEAQAQAQSLGILGAQVGFALLPAAKEAMICLNAVLVDDRQRAWLIRSAPFAPEANETIYARFLVSLIDPANLPDGIIF